MEYGPLLGCAIGLVCIAATARGAYESIHRSRWRQTEGRVLRTYVSETTHGRQVSYSAVMEYRYAHMGRPHTGTLHCGRSTHFKKQADDSILPYSAGQILDVYVYTRRPANSKLGPEFNPSELGIACLGALFFIACLAIFFSVNPAAFS